MTIDRIAKGGDGVGRANGLACFVPRTAPGDVAQVAYVAHARHGRGRVLQIVTPSAHRVEARCVHYERDRCGGCQLQHLDDATQREARRHIVQDALSRIGKRTIELPDGTTIAGRVIEINLEGENRPRAGFPAGMNRNLWGVENFEEINIRHSKFAANRFAHEAAPACRGG